MDVFNKPEPLSFDGNLSVNYSIFLRDFETFLTASEKNTKPDAVKIAIFLNFIGEEGRKRYYSWDLQPTEAGGSLTFDQVRLVFFEYCNPKKNTIYERIKFYQIRQGSETFEDFLTNLRHAAQGCEFIDDDSMIRDFIIMGINNNKLREKLMNNPNLTLEGCISECRIADLDKWRSTETQEKMNAEVKLELDAVRNKNERWTSGKNFTNVNNGYRGNNNFESTTPTINCTRCLLSHVKNKCPAYGKICHFCNATGHFMKACIKFKSRQNTHQTNEVTVKTSNEDANINQLYFDSIFINNLSSSQKSLKSWSEELTVGEHRFKIKIDTGAEENILPVDTFKMLNINMDRVVPCKHILESYSGDVLKSFGEVWLSCRMGDSEVKFVKFVIIKTDKMPLMGLETAEEFGLVMRRNVFNIREVNKEQIIEKYSTVFEGLGCFKEPCILRTKPNAVPKYHPARRVPLALQSKLKETLTSMEKNNVIEKVEHPSGWVSNMVIVEKKDGTLRLCLDPKDLNEALHQEKYLIPNLDELRSKLCGTKFFSVLDLQAGFWQVPLTPESSELCTFSTPFGCFKFLRLPFGINVAPEIFQRYTCEAFSDLPKTGVYMDDVLVGGSTVEEHDSNLEKVLKRAQSLGIRFNKQKFQHKVSEVKYVGQIFSQNGISPDPGIVRAIQNLSRPTDKKALQSILGMINYLRMYVPNMSSNCEHMNALLKKDACFEWLPVHDQEFEKVKRLIVNATTLNHFNKDLECTIQSDASQYGIGACLLQNNKPIAFASRSLTESEKHFSQIEKELLAICFATHKFHYYVYGTEFEVNTDHKPLISIFKKDLSKVYCTRLQRMRLKLLKYKIKLNFVPGKYLHVADLLSRNNDKDEIQEDTTEFSEVIHSINISEIRTLQIIKETNSDEVLSKIKFYCKTNWPSDVSKVPEALRYFYKIKDNLYCENEILYFDDRVFIPQTIRKDVLKLIHTAHLGIQKTTERAKELVYWPFMSKDIELLINNCQTCQKYMKSNYKEPIKFHEIPQLRWTKIGMDILNKLNKDYLIVVDYFSKWLDIIELKNKTVKEIISHLKIIFSTHGIPKEIVSDNSPFNSKEFKDFTNGLGIFFNPSSPRYPQSNGMAERNVGIAKNLITKSLESGQELYLSLLEFRNTPIHSLGASPSQILFSRRCRTRIPIHDSKLEPKIVTNVLDNIKKSQIKTQFYYNQKTRPRNDFTKDDSIYFQKNDRLWHPGKVVEVHKSARSYIVEDEDGSKYRRNKSMVRTSKSYQNEEQAHDHERTLSNNHSSKVGNDSPATDENISFNSAHNSTLTEFLGFENSDHDTATTTRSGRVSKPTRRLIEEV